MANVTKRPVKMQRNRKLGFDTDGGDYDRLLHITTRARIWGRFNK